MAVGTHGWVYEGIEHGLPVPLLLHSVVPAAPAPPDLPPRLGRPLARRGGREDGEQRGEEGSGRRGEREGGREGGQEGDEAESTLHAHCLHCPLPVPSPPLPCLAGIGTAPSLAAPPAGPQRRALCCCDEDLKSCLGTAPSLAAPPARPQRRARCCCYECMKSHINPHSSPPSLPPSNPSLLCVQVLAQHRPSLHRLLDHSDELSAAALLLLEWHSLKTHGASFGESMYGLRRISTVPHRPSPSQAALRTEAAAGRAEGAGRGERAAGGQEGGSASYGMSRKQRALSLLFLVSWRLGLGFRVKGFRLGMQGVCAAALPARQAACSVCYPPKADAGPLFKSTQLHPIPSTTRQVLLPYLRTKLHSLFAAHQRQRQARALWVGGDGADEGWGGAEEGEWGAGRDGGDSGLGHGQGDGYGGASGGEERSESGSSPGSMDSVGSLHGREQSDDGLGTDGLRDETPGGGRGAEEGVAAAARASAGRDGQQEGGAAEEQAGGHGGQMVPGGHVARRNGAGSISRSRGSARGSRRWRQVVRVLRWAQRRAVRGAAAAYPWLQAPYEGVCLLYQLLYVMDATPHYSPILHLLSLSLRRATPQELVRLCGCIVSTYDLQRPRPLSPPAASESLSASQAHALYGSEGTGLIGHLCFLIRPPSPLFSSLLPPTLTRLPQSSPLPIQTKQAEGRDAGDAVTTKPTAAVVSGASPLTAEASSHPSLAPTPIQTRPCKQRFLKPSISPWTMRRRHASSATQGPLFHNGLCADAVQAALLKALYFTMDYAQTSVIAAVFAFKMAEWWYQTGEQKLSAPTVYPPPPPPLPPKASSFFKECGIPVPADRFLCLPLPLLPLPYNPFLYDPFLFNFLLSPLQVAPAGIPVPSDRSLCPLCLCRRTNPTAPATSGFIFCYPCIFAYVDKVGWHQAKVCTLAGTGLERSPRDGSGLERSPRDGSGLERSPREGSGLERSPRDGSGLERSPGDGSGLERSPRDGSGLERSPRDGSGLERSPRDGSGLERSPRDGSGLERSPRDGSGLERSPRDGSGLERSPRDGSGLVLHHC
ncbi:unnamed protein product [Closterium sp. NIES-64]|nr:unnamed protein product [Closterium sp. NIES-64]